MAGKDELKDVEDIFNVNDADDMEDFMNMLDSIDVDNNPLLQEMETTNTKQVEEQLQESAEEVQEEPLFLNEEDLYKLTEDEQVESAKKIDGMMAELGLGNAVQAEEKVEEKETSLEDTTAFVPSEDENIMELLDSVVKDEEPIETKDVEEAVDESVEELAEILETLPEEKPEATADSVEAVPKKSFFQKLIEMFHKQPTEEELLQQAQEEEEERVWEEHEQKVKSEKKAEAEEKKKAKKAETEQKEKEKKEKAEANKAAKQKKNEEKAAAKAAKKAEKEAKRGPIPKSQLVPVKPMLVFVIIGIAFSVAFVVFTNHRFYDASVSDSKEKFIHQQYKEAYETLLGLEIQKKDEKFYDQVRTVRTIDKDLDAYNNYVKVGDYKMALESLIKGIGKYESQTEKAKELSLEKEMYGIYEEMLKELTVRFGITAQEAMNLYNSNDKETYEKQISQISRDAAIRDGVMEPVEITEVEQ